MCYNYDLVPSKKGTYLRIQQPDLIQDTDHIGIRVLPVPQVPDLQNNTLSSLIVRTAGGVPRGAMA